MPIHYVEHAALERMSMPYRACHGLLATGIECLSRATGIMKERGLDEAVIAETTAAMALACAARAMVIAIHQTRSVNGEKNAVDFCERTGNEPTL